MILALCLPFRECQDLLLKQQKVQEKKLEKLAKQLPVWSWVENVRGVGPLSLAQMIGELGDLSGYSNPAKPWKRMGLGLVAYPCPKCCKEEFERFVSAIKEGQATCETQNTPAKDSDQEVHETQDQNVPNLGQYHCETQQSHAKDSDQARPETHIVDVPNSDQSKVETQKPSVLQAASDEKERQSRGVCVHGYPDQLPVDAPPGTCKKCAGKGFIQEAQRKCVDKKIALIHGYNPKRRSIMWNVGVCLIKQNDGKYRQMYDDQKSYQIQVRELTKIHAHRRAQRYMEKALLLDLWVQWNQREDETQTPVVPPEAA